GPGNISGNRVRTVTRQGEVMGLNRASGVRNQYGAVSRKPANPRLLLAAIFNQLDHIADLEMFVRSRNKGPLDPMVDRRRVPGQCGDLVLEGRVVDVRSCKGGLDLECIERAGLGCDAFLSNHLRSARSFPDISVRAVDVVGAHGPGFADLERRLNAATVVRRVSPGTVFDHGPRAVINRQPAFIAVATNFSVSDADGGRRHFGDGVLPDCGDASRDLVA